MAEAMHNDARFLHPGYDQAFRENAINGASGQRQSFCCQHLASAIVTRGRRKEGVGALQWTGAQGKIGLQRVIHFAHELDGFVGGSPPFSMDPQFPDLSRNRLLQMGHLSPADFDGPESGLQHEIGHRVIAAPLERAFARVRLKGGQEDLGVVGRQMASGMGTAAVPACEKGRVIYKPRVEADQKSQELPERDEVAVFRPGVGEMLIEIGAIGFERGAIEAASVGRIQLTEPPEKGRPSFVIGDRGGGRGMQAFQLIREPFEIDP